jgi:hypothetical protein
MSILERDSSLSCDQILPFYPCILMPQLHSPMQVGDCFAQDTRGLLFWQNASEAFVAQFYSAVLALEESSNLERLKSVLVSPASTCSAVASSMQAVTINQVSKHRLIFNIVFVIFVCPARNISHGVTRDLLVYHRFKLRLCLFADLRPWYHSCRGHICSVSSSSCCASIQRKEVCCFCGTKAEIE